METAQKETNHNLWYRIVAKAEADKEFKARLLENAKHILGQEKKDIQKEIMTDLINNPEKMEEVFGDLESAEGMEIEEMEERLAAFGYIGW